MIVQFGKIEKNDKMEPKDKTVQNENVESIDKTEQEDRIDRSGRTEPDDKADKKISIGEIVKSITALIGSRLVCAGLLIFLGIRITINPNSAPGKIAWGIGLAILICTAGLLIGFLTTGSFRRGNLILILETILFTILGACMIIFSKAFGAVLEELVFTGIIINSIANLFCLWDLDKSGARLDRMAKEHRMRQERDPVVQSIAVAVKEDFEKYNGELIHAVGTVKRKADATLWGQVILNAALILVSLIMLVSRFSDTAPVYQIAGIVMILSGVNELLLVVRGYRERKKGKRIAVQKHEDITVGA